MILAYWRFAEEYYGFTPERGDAACLRGVLAVVRQLYGNTRALPEHNDPEYKELRRVALALVREALDPALDDD